MVWKMEMVAAALAGAGAVPGNHFAGGSSWCSMDEKPVLPRHGFPFNTILCTVECNKSLAFFIGEKKTFTYSDFSQSFVPFSPAWAHPTQPPLSQGLDLHPPPLSTSSDRSLVQLPVLLRCFN